MQEALPNAKNCIRYLLFTSIYRILDVVELDLSWLQGKDLASKKQAEFQHYTDVLCALVSTQLCIYLTLAELFRAVQKIVF